MYWAIDPSQLTVPKFFPQITSFLPQVQFMFSTQFWSSESPLANPVSFCLIQFGLGFPVTCQSEVLTDTVYKQPAGRS
jgi:hypothetical protein